MLWFKLVPLFSSGPRLYFGIFLYVTLDPIISIFPLISQDYYGIYDVGTLRKVYAASQ